MIHHHNFTRAMPRPTIERGPGYDLRAEQIRLLMTAGIPSDEIDRIMRAIDEGEAL